MGVQAQVTHKSTEALDRALAVFCQLSGLKLQMAPQALELCRADHKAVGDEGQHERMHRHQRLVGDREREVILLIVAVAELVELVQDEAHQVRLHAVRKLGYA